MNELTPKVLYHYCSFETFFSIIDHQCIWLSDSLSTNDFLENKWLELMLEEVIEQNPDLGKNQYYQHLVTNFSINQRPTYITCFSKNGDLLSQWRAYADDGFGVSIGFNTDYFAIPNHLPHTMAVFNKDVIGFGKVIYRKEEQLAILKQLVTSGLADKKEAFETAVALRRLSYIFKNPAFCEEEEWRIIHTPLTLGNENDHSPKVMGAISEIKFRACRYDLIPYFILPFKETKSISPIKEILLGPKNKATQAKIEMLLSAKGFSDVEIHFSKASYR